MNKITGIDAVNNNVLAVDHKPCKSIANLIEAISKDLDVIAIDKSSIIHYEQEGLSNCIILHSGRMAVHRRGDGMIISTEKAPFIFGLSNQMNFKNKMYLRALEKCELSLIDLNESNEIIRNSNLWHSMCDLLIYTSSRIFEHCAQIQQMSAYDIIRFQLYELSRESEDVRLSTTVPNYIKTRTFLSRSGIMRILSELRTGGYIDMTNGYLKSINHLPRKF